MLVGKKLGPYLVERELGSGAMGSVYGGVEEQTGQQVAIKIISPALMGNEAARKRFEREIAILKQLEHPHIIRIFRSGRWQNTPFYVMEYVEGESLDHVLERRGRLTWEEIVILGKQLCGALQYAHDKGIIHRDLKPANLMLVKNGGDIKLTDFGIAKDIDVTALTGANSTVGTAAYMSPEQCKGVRDLTPRSDLYSMGVMFYEMLTGRKPFQAETAMEMFVQHTRGKFPRPARINLDIPVWLDTLVCQLLEKDPEQRPGSAEIVARSLDEVKEKMEGQASAGVAAATRRRADKTAHDITLDDQDKETARSLIGKKKKKKAVPIHRRGWFTGAVSLLALAGLVAGAWWVFFAPESAESLLRRAERTLQEKAWENRRQAREPLTTFLATYAEHPRAKEAQGWADALDLEECDRQMHNRRNAKFKADGDAEELAWAALDAEDVGKLAEAAVTWKSLLKYRTSGKREERSWGLVAAKYLQELNAVAELANGTAAQVQAEIDSGKTASAENQAENLARTAFRHELRRELPQALVAWKDLKVETAGKDEQRRWYLLAAGKVRELETTSK